MPSKVKLTTKKHANISLLPEVKRTPIQKI